MALTQEYTDAITKAVRHAKENDHSAQRVVIAKFDRGWSDERSTISVTGRTVTLETMGQQFDTYLLKELLAELFRQTGVKHEVFPFVDSIGYGFMME